MDVMLIVGAIVGALLFITKLGSFYLLVPKRARKWIHSKPLLQGLLDIGFGAIGMHVVTIGGGSLTAMISMVVFGSLSMGYIFTNIAWHKSKSLIDQYIS